MLDRIDGGNEEHRDVRGCVSRGLSGPDAPGCGDQFHPSLNEVPQQRHQSIFIAFRPALLDLDVPTVPETLFIQTFVKGRNEPRKWFSPGAVEKSDHRRFRPSLKGGERPLTGPPAHSDKFNN